MHAKNYFFANIVTKALGLISIPFLTYLLTPFDYGVISLYNGFLGVFVTLLTFNFYSSIGRYFFEGKDDLSTFFGTVIILNFSLLVLFGICFYFFREEIALLIQLPIAAILFIVPSVMVYSASSFYEQIFSALQRSKHIAIRNIIIGYLSVFLSIFIIYFMSKDKYLGYLSANLCVGTISIVYYFVILKPYIKFSFSIKYLKYIFSYSIPLIPYTLSWALFPQIDRIMINQYQGMNDVGLYSFGANIGMLLLLFSGSIYQAWNPIYYKYMNEKNYVKIDKEAIFIFKCILIGTIFLIYFGKELGMVLGAKNYHEAVGVIPILVIGYLFNSTFAFYGWAIGYAKKNIYLSVAVLISMALNIILNFFLIPKYGYYGAALSTTISYLILTIITFFVSKYVLNQHVTPILRFFVDFCKIIPFICIFYLFTNFVRISLLLEFVLKFLFIFLFILIIFPELYNLIKQLGLSKKKTK